MPIRMTAIYDKQKQQNVPNSILSAASRLSMLMSR